MEISTTPGTFIVILCITAAVLTGNVAWIAGAIGFVVAGIFLDKR